MNQRFSAYLISIFASLISLGAFALEWKDVDGKGCRPGVYTYDYNAAIEYAKTHHRFILAFEGKLDGTCNNCKNTSAQTYGREDFRQWAAQNNIPLVYGDYTPMTGYTRATYNWVVQFTNQQTFPQAAIIDEDGVTRLGAWEPIAPSGPNLSTRFYSKINPNFKGTQYFAFRNDPPVPDSVFNFLSACIELCDDTWQVARKLPATKEPFTWNMYYDLGTNTLRTAYVSAGRKRYTDAVDWYVITDKPAAGMGFWLKAENVVDEKNYGKVLVFGSEADAKAETNPLFAEISLKDFEQGLLVKNPGAKTYIKIYRTDDLPADEIVDVRYALTVQQKEANDQYFAFTQPDNQLWEDYSARGTEYPIAVIRKEAGKAETVTVCVSPNPDPGYDPAVWGKDFTLRGTNVTFAVDQLTNFVYVTTISNTTMTSVSPRVCKLTLTPATTPQTGYPTTYLTILDCEMRREAPQGDDIILCAREEGQTRVVTLQTAAYGDDVYDDYVNYYVLTNAPSSVGSIYVFSLQLNEFSNVPGDELKIGIYTNRDDCVRGEGALVTKTLLAKDVHEEPVRIEWGSGLDTGYPPEVFLRVARAPQSQERKEWNPNLRLRYSLEWWRWDRPVASFADAETAFATALTDRTFRVEVPADYSQAMLEDLADAGKDPGFKVKWTAIPGPGSAEDWYELPDMDPVAVTTNAPGAIPVKLVPPQRFVRHDETLGFSLQPSDSPAVQDIYARGDQVDFTLTLRADVAKPAATEGAPFRCEVTAGGDGQTDWLVAADRNASYTNCEDWVEFVAQDTNEFFRIAVTNVTLLAAEADEIGVSVCRNDGTGKKALVREFKLDELTDPATAPVLSFAGFTDRSVFVRIHRKVSEDVRLDYGLLFREWRPSKGDGGRLDEGDLADPPDDTREGAVVFTPDADGTNVIRTLHGFETVPGGNGRPYAVNDTNDWYRLTGLRSGGRYAFEFLRVDANVDVSVSFYRAGSDAALTNLTVSKGTWWFYDAADDGDLYARVSRGAACQVPAAVDYTLRVSAYVWPVFAFDGPKDVEVDCTTGAVSLTVLRKESANGGAVIRFEPTLSKWAENVILARSMATEILFADGSGVTNFTVGIREPVPDVWTGDWSCEFALVVDTSRYAYGTPSNVVLTVRDTHEPQLDAADAWDDVKSGATALAAGTTVTNRLNGIDARAGARTDTNDWFRVAGQARSHYRLRLGVVAASCTNGLEIAVAVVADGQTKTYTLAEAIEGIVVSRAEAGDFHVRIVRGTATEELPVSFKYELALDREDWPSFTVEAVRATVTNDESEAGFVIRRDANLDAGDRVRLLVEDTNAVKVVASVLPVEVTFAPGEAVVTNGVPLAPQAEGFWLRGGEFKVTLAQDPADGEVMFRSPSNAVVRVVDASGLPEDDYWQDRVEAGAQQYSFTRSFQLATNHCAAGQSVVWLNGNDTADWFWFKGTQVGKAYRLAVTNFASRTEGAVLNMEVYAATQAGPGRRLSVDAVGDGFSAKWKAEREYGFYVKMCRPADAAPDDSLHYVLKFREAPTCRVRFAATSATVDERATAVYVDVVCATESGEALEKDIVVTVNPTVDESVAHPAVPWTDFDPTPVSVSWLAGSTGGVRRVGIRLTNYDNVWEGDETFLLRLAKDEQIEAELTDPAEMCVTITDKDAPVYGTVGIVGYDGTAVREGGVFPVTLARVDGCSGVVTGKFSWTIGRTKVDRLVELFGDREDGEKTIELAVPETGASSALSQAGTLAFALSVPAKTATVTKGTPTSIKLTVFTKDYGDELPAYSADDPTKVGFVTSASAWYLAADGSLGCLTPKAGAVALMNATVNGPGKLYVDATLVDAEKCELYALVSGVRTDLANGPDQAIDIPAGSRVVQIVFSRPKTTSAVSTKDTARAFVDNVRFVPGEGFRKTGTFTGAVSVKASGEAEATAGLGTLTVSALGRMSGKLQCANRTWTFDSDAGWDASGRAEPTARSGVAELPIILTVDGQTGVVTVGGEGVAGELVRNAWGDRPLAAAEIAAGEAFVGYYTLSLAGTADFGSGYLGITVNANGMVKATGMLADGQSVSLSGTLAPAAEGSATAFLYAAPSAYRGGWFALTVGFVRPADGPAYLVAAEGTGLPSWVRKGATGESLYARTPTPVGGAYGTVENLHDHYQGRLLKVGELDAVPELAVAGTSVAARFWAADAAHPVVLEFNESGTAVKAASDGDLFAMDFTRATGIFTGSIGANYLYQLGDVERETEVPIVCRGILTPCRENPDDGVEGRGYYLISGASQDVRIEQTED